MSANFSHSWCLRPNHLMNNARFMFGLAMDFQLFIAARTSKVHNSHQCAVYFRWKCLIEWQIGSMLFGDWGGTYFFFQHDVLLQIVCNRCGIFSASHSLRRIRLEDEYVCRRGFSMVLFKLNHHCLQLCDCPFLFNLKNIIYSCSFLTWCEKYLKISLG